jgi:hypothetical protein
MYCYGITIPVMEQSKLSKGHCCGFLLGFCIQLLNVPNFQETYCLHFKVTESGSSGWWSSWVEWSVLIICEGWRKFGQSELWKGYDSRGLVPNLYRIQISNKMHTFNHLHSNTPTWFEPYDFIQRKYVIHNIIMHV